MAEELRKWEALASERQLEGCEASVSPLVDRLGVRCGDMLCSEKVRRVRARVHVHV